MIVKCKNIYNESTKQYQDKSECLTIGNTYIVLEIEFYSDGRAAYRLVEDDEDQSPALFDSKQFEVVSGSLPSNWYIFNMPNNGFTIGPKTWQERGFWEKYYDDDDPEALETYKREVRLIYEQAGE